MECYMNPSPQDQSFSVPSTHTPSVDPANHVDPVNQQVDPINQIDLRVSANAKLSHQDIGIEMNLFRQVDFAPGSPVLLPNGTIMYRVLQGRMRNLMEDVGGYSDVRAPVLVKQELFRTSGHMEKYADNMFLFESNEDQLALKPMNCPIHMMIFKMDQHSYRDLPIRLHDESTLHRKEQSGTLNCMARLQQFHQDDTHIFVTPEQLAGELSRLLNLVDRVYRNMDMNYFVRLSTRPEKFIGEIEVWNNAEKALTDELDRLGLPYKIDAGGGAFYGPKIDIDVIAANGKPWQVATSQLDFNLPERFDLSYINKAGLPQRPIVIHSALFGAYERFMALYLEHTQGNLPFWLAPEQVRVLPISEKSLVYAEEVQALLKASGVRNSLDVEGGTLGARIKAARPMRIPFLAVTGEKEAAERSVSVRNRDTGKSESMPLEVFLKEISKLNSFNF